MKSAISIVVAVAVTLSYAGERPREIESYESAFHTMLHDGHEFYLVCFYSIEKKPWVRDWEQLHIDATIVEAIRGPGKVGSKLSFRRVMDGQFGDVSHLLGGLYFVRLDQDEATGEVSVDPQDPQAVFSYSEAFRKMAIRHKK